MHYYERRICTLIYADNAATSWPKPQGVPDSMREMICDIGANPGRGGHRLSIEAGRLVYQTREKLARFFKLEESERLIFTLNTTDGLNLVIKGILSPGDHVITSVLEHNSVLRPLQNLSRKGLQIDLVECDGEGFIDPDAVLSKVKRNTKMVILNHASNVLGTLQPIEAVGEKLKEKDVFFLVDAAQTAGVCPIDLGSLPVDALAFSGHKGLLGPQGIGGLYIAAGREKGFWREGGTGSHSERPEQPLELPDRYESGTPNTPGIAGLGAGIDFLMANGVSHMLENERQLMQTLYQGIKDLSGVFIYGPGDFSRCVPVMGFNHSKINSQELCMILDQHYDIASRGGLHCAPKIHEFMGTHTSGMARLSLGPFNTREDVKEIIKALEEIDVHLN